MYFYEFIKFTVACKSQFAKRYIFEILYEFFGYEGDIWNCEIGYYWCIRWIDSYLHLHFANWPLHATVNLINS